MEDEEALEFLRNLGLEKPDIFAEIDQFVPNYDKELPEVSEKEHIEDLKKILKAFFTHHKDKVISRMKNKPFILAENIVKNKVEYKKPADIYFKKDELRIYFDGNENIWFLSDIYNEKLLNEFDKSDIGEDKLREFFKTFGVRDSVKVERKESSASGHVVVKDYYGLHERGLNGFDPDIEVEGLEHALKSISIEKSLYIWNHIARKNSDCIQGTIEKSSRQDFSNSEKKNTHTQRILVNC